MKTVIVVAASIVAFFLLVSLAGGYYMFRFAVVRRRGEHGYWDCEIPKKRHIPDELYEQMKLGKKFIKAKNPEKVTIKSPDGLKLTARIAENPAGRGMFIMIHGYRSCGLYDFSFVLKQVYDKGFSLMIIDQRAHGDSEGKYIGFGVLERYDVVRWCEYVKERYPTLPVVLDGVSMGASTVMMGCGVGYPDNVRALICDCGYTTPGAVCRRTLKRWFKLPPFPIYYVAKMFVRIFAGYSLDSVNSAKELLCDKLPVLMAHGKKDTFVPYSMGIENFSSLAGRDDCEFFISEEAEHGMSYVMDTDGYMEAMERLSEKAGI